MKTPRILQVIAVSILMAIRCFGAEVVEVKLPHPVSRILLFEDNSYLAIAHYQSNQVSLLNTSTLTVDATLSVPSPGPMLNRGGNLYISDSEHGVIKVFSTKDWKLVNEVATGDDAVVYLSAPQRTYFGSKFLVTTIQKSDGVKTVRLVDAVNDTHAVIGNEKSDFACYSYNGKYVMERTRTQGRPGLVAYESTKYLPGNKVEIARNTDDHDQEIFQNADNDFWFADRVIRIGLPPKSQMLHELPGFVIPDNTEGSLNCYLLNPNGSQLAVHRLDDEFSQLDEIKILRERGLMITPRAKGALSADVGTNSYAFSGNGNNTVFFIDANSKLQVVRFPAGVSIGMPYSKQLDKADKYFILKAPPGSTLSDSGLLKWTPDVNTTEGDYVFKVRLERPEGTAFFHDQISIRRQSYPKGTAPTLKFTGDIAIESDPYGDRLLIHSDDKLAQYDVSGTRIISSGSLGHNYQKVIAGKGYIAALDKNAVSIFDPVSYKLIRSIEFGAYEARGMVLDRTRNQLFVGGFDPAEKNPAAMYPIYRVDPAKGTRQVVKRAIGATLFINNRLGVLVSAVGETKINMIGMGYIRERIDLMAVYRIEGEELKMEGAIQDFVTGIRSVQFSSDGRHLIAHAGGTAYGGEQTYNTSPVFEINNVNKPLDFIRANPAYKLGQNLAIVTHPYLDLVAVLTACDPQNTDNQTLLLLRDLAGNDVTQKYGVPSVLKRKVTSLCFTPDGKTLMFSGRDFYGRPIVESVPLVLTQADLNARTTAAAPVRTGAITPPSTSAGTTSTPSASETRGKGLALWQAGRLMESRIRAISPDAISMMNMPTVVVIRNDNGSTGAGFFVSNNGYIVTAAHVVSPLGKPTVTCYFDFIFNYRAVFEVKAEVVSVDENLDLALLKIDTGASTNFVRLDKKTPKQGEPVFTIGHPGLAAASLNYTMTSGLVSNPSQTINDRSYLQISAPVNPGNSGGPVFDGAGNVIGMVVQKSALDGVAFAVPAEDIVAFLSTTLDRSQTKDPGETVFDAGIRQLRAKGLTPLSDLTFVGNVASLRGRMELFTGKAAVLNAAGKIWVTADMKAGKASGYICEYYPDQKLKYQAGTLAGQRHGPQKSWYPSGNPRLESELKQGVLDGVERMFYDEPDRVWTMRTFRDGRMDGLAYEMNDLGRVTKRYIFKQGNLVHDEALYDPSRTPGDPYLESIRAGDVEMIRRHALKRKSPSGGKNAETPIQLAIDTDMPEVVAEVIRNGADVNAVDRQGQSPLQRAQARKPANEQIIRMLSQNTAASGR